MWELVYNISKEEDLNKIYVYSHFQVKKVSVLKY